MMKRAILFLSLLFSACSSEHVEIDPYISNENAERFLIEYAGDSKRSELSLESFLQDLSHRPAPDFDWARFWNFMRTRGPVPPAHNTNAWSHIVVTRKFFCESQGAMSAYYEFALDQRERKTIQNPETLFSVVGMCMSFQPENFKREVFARELSSQTPSWALLVQTYKSMTELERGRLTSQDFDRLSAKTETLLLDSGTASLPESLSELLNEALKDLQRNTRHTAFMTTMNRLSQNSSFSQKASPKTMVMTLRGTMEESLFESSGASWLKAYGTALLRGLETNQIEWTEAINRLNDVFERMNSASASQKAQIASSIEDWLIQFDEAVDSLYLFALSTQGEKTKLSEALTKARASTTIEIWLWTLLHGQSVTDHFTAIIPALSDAANPLEKFILHRIQLRNRLHMKPEDLPKHWWGDPAICPIPSLLPSGELEFDRSFVTLQDAKEKKLKRACIKVDRDSALSDAPSSYDVFVFAPSQKIDLNGPVSKIILDVSGERQARFSPEILAGKDGKVLPLILREAPDTTRTPRWFLFQFIVQAPEAPRVTTSRPAKAANAGTLLNSRKSPLPLWIRSFGAQSTQGHEALAQVQAAQAVRVSESRLEESIQSLLGFNYISVGAQLDRAFFAGDRARLKLREKILAGQFRPVDADTYKRLLTSIVLETRDLGEIQKLWDEFSSDPDWEGRVLAQLKDLVLSAVVEGPLLDRFRALPQNLVLIPIEPSIAGEDGERGEDAEKVQGSENSFQFPRKGHLQ